MIRVGSSGCIYLFLTCLFPCLSMCLLKGRARSRLGITDGNVCEDCCTAFLCTPCVNCQVSLGYFLGISYQSNCLGGHANARKYSHSLRWPTRLTPAFEENTKKTKFKKSL